MIYPYIYFNVPGTPGEQAAEEVAPTPLQASADLFTEEKIQELKDEFIKKKEELKSHNLEDWRSTPDERRLAWDIGRILTLVEQLENGVQNTPEWVEVTTEFNAALASLKMEVEENKADIDKELARRAESVASTLDGFSLSWDEWKAIRDLFWIQDGGKDYWAAANLIRAFQEQQKLKPDGIIWTETLTRLTSFMEKNGDISSPDQLRRYVYGLPEEFAGIVETTGDMRKSISEALSTTVDIDQAWGYIQDPTLLGLDGSYEVGTQELEDGSFTFTATKEGKTMIWDPEKEEWKKGDSLVEPTELEKDWKSATELTYGEPDDGTDYDDGLGRSEWVEHSGYEYRQVADGSIEKRIIEEDGSGHIERRDEQGNWVSADKYTPSYKESERERMFAEKEWEWIDDPEWDKDHKYMRVGDTVYAFPNDAEFTYDTESWKIIPVEWTRVQSYTVGSRTEEGRWKWESLDDISALDLPQDLVAAHQKKWNEGLEAFIMDTDPFHPNEDEKMFTIDGVDDGTTFLKLYTTDSEGSINAAAGKKVTISDPRVESSYTIQWVTEAFRDTNQVVELTGDPGTDLRLIEQARESLNGTVASQERQQSLHQEIYDIYSKNDFYNGMGLWQHVASQAARDLAKHIIGTETETWSKMDESHIWALADAYIAKYRVEWSDEDLTDIDAFRGDRVAENFSDLARLQVEWFAQWDEEYTARFGKPGTIAADTKIEERDGKLYLPGSPVQIDFSPMYENLGKKDTTEASARATLASLKEWAPRSVYARAVQTAFENATYGKDAIMTIIPELQNAGSNGIPEELYSVTSQQWIRTLAKVLDDQQLSDKTFEGLDPVADKWFIEAIGQYSPSLRGRMIQIAQTNEDFANLLVQGGLIKRAADGWLLATNI